LLPQALKSNDGSGASYIAYVIRTTFPSSRFPPLESKHRYSEFEALRTILTKLYPHIVVPPIPGKHSYADYAAKPGKAKEDPRIIHLRKRLLESFLNRVAAHPMLAEVHVFHRFLQGDASWGEIVNASGLAGLLRAKDSLANVPEGGQLRHPDPHFEAAENYTIRFEKQITHTQKVQKRVSKHHTDTAATCSDLGASYNGWSLTETTLSPAIEQMGQALDTTAGATQQLALALEERFSERLSEYRQLSAIVERLLSWRHKKHFEQESIIENLVAKQAALARLESSEAEAQRLAAVLHAEGAPSASTSSRPLSTSSTGSSTSPTSNPPPANPALFPPTNPHPPARPTGLLATLNSLIDNDPETSRRNSISKTKDRIASLLEARASGGRELATANEEIQRDLDRFQMDKIGDLRSMMLAYALAQREYHRKATGAWEEARAEVERIPIAE
ncbi:hypothetical protein BDK51DRAFT_20898, partial [Blyttiomyces helicus]